MYCYYCYYDGDKYKDETIQNCIQSFEISVKRQTQ